MTLLPNGIGGLSGKHITLLFEAWAPCLIGNYRTITRLRIAADLLHVLWPKIARGLLLVIAAGILICVRSGW